MRWRSRNECDAAAPLLGGRLPSGGRSGDVEKSGAGYWSAGQGGAWWRDLLFAPEA
jgi:hypothetical protein